MFGNIAQLAEQSTVNRFVVGSNPTVSVSFLLSKQALDNKNGNYPAKDILLYHPALERGLTANQCVPLLESGSNPGYSALPQ